MSETTETTAPASEPAIIAPVPTGLRLHHILGNFFINAEADLRKIGVEASDEINAILSKIEAAIKAA